MSHKNFLSQAWKMFEQNPQMWASVESESESSESGNGNDKKEKTDGATASTGGTNEDHQPDTE